MKCPTNKDSEIQFNCKCKGLPTGGWTYNPDMASTVYNCRCKVCGNTCRCVEEDKPINERRKQ